MRVGGSSDGLIADQQDARSRDEHDVSEGRRTPLTYPPLRRRQLLDREARDRAVLSNEPPFARPIDPPKPKGTSGNSPIRCVPTQANTEGTMTEFSNAQIKYLKSQRLGRLATLRPDGTLQNNPVGFSLDEASGTIEIGGFNMGGSQKYKNIVANGQAAFVVDELETVDPWKPRMVEIRGTADANPNEDPRNSTIRIHPLRVISFGIGE